MACLLAETSTLQPKRRGNIVMEMHRKYLLFGCLIFALFWPACSKKPTEHFIWLKITDAAGNLVPSAKLSSTSNLTARLDKMSFGPTKPEYQWELTVTAAVGEKVKIGVADETGFMVGEVVVTIKDSQIQFDELQLEQDTSASVKGSVEAADGHLLAGVRVWANKKSDGSKVETTTSELGAFILPVEAGVDQTVEVSFEGVVKGKTISMKQDCVASPSYVNIIQLAKRMPD